MIGFLMTVEQAELWLIVKARLEAKLTRWPGAIVMLRPQPNGVNAAIVYEPGDETFIVRNTFQSGASDSDISEGCDLMMKSLRKSVENAIKAA